MGMGCASLIVGRLCSSMKDQLIHEPVHPELRRALVSKTQEESSLVSRINAHLELCTSYTCEHTSSGPLGSLSASTARSSGS